MHLTWTYLAVISQKEKSQVKRKSWFDDLGKESRKRRKGRLRLWRCSLAAKKRPRSAPYLKNLLYLNYHPNSNDRRNVTGNFSRFNQLPLYSHLCYYDSHLGKEVKGPRSMFQWPFSVIRSENCPLCRKLFRLALWRFGFKIFCSGEKVGQDEEAAV